MRPSSLSGDGNLSWKPRVVLLQHQVPGFVWSVIRELRAPMGRERSCALEDTSEEISFRCWTRVTWRDVITADSYHAVCLDNVRLLT